MIVVKVGGKKLFGSLEVLKVLDLMDLYCLLEVTAKKQSLFFSGVWPEWRHSAAGVGHLLVDWE